MLEIFDEIEQGTESWKALRLGIPTASCFHKVMASGRGGAESKTRQEYLLKLAGEVLTGEPMDNYVNGHMTRGKEMEDEARNLYAFMTDAELKRVGFIKNGPKGCSPDSLIGEHGMVEFKTALPHILIEMLLSPSDWFPPQHRAQTQGGLWVAERQWCDLVVFWPKLPLFVRRAHRDAVYLQKLADDVEVFNAELAQTIEKVRGYTHARAA